MYLFGNTYFEILTIKRIFQVVFIFFLISEMIIWVFTSLNSGSILSLIGIALSFRSFEGDCRNFNYYKVCVESPLLKVWDG